MKIWYGHGSEHSMNLVMIGKFKTAKEAENAFDVLTQLQHGLEEHVDLDSPRERYSDATRDLLTRLKCHNLGPNELEQFLYHHEARLEDDQVIITTEESDVSAFLKTMVEKGAKVEIFSGHDYPDAEYGRGK